MAANKRYILLIATWSLVLGSIIYLWITKTSPINTGQWIVLTILSLVPLAERLKVGDWFDFKSRVDNIDKEVSSVRRDIARINNELRQNNIQRQQLINISLTTEETARAFAQNMGWKEPKYSSEEALGIEPEEDNQEGLPVIKTIKKADLDRMYFIQAANEAIASVEPLLYLIYGVIITKRNDRPAESEDILGKELSEMICDIKEHASEVFSIKDSKTKFTNLLTPMEKLVALRKDVAESKAQIPVVDYARSLISDVHNSKAYLTGAIAAILDSLVLGRILNSFSVRQPNTVNTDSS